MNLKTYDDGDVILNPMTGWTVAPVADTVVLLAVEYVSSPSELESGARQQLQLVVNPQQALELADALARKALAILQQPSEPRPN